MCIRDRRAVCTYRHIFGFGLSDDVVKISPLPTPVAMATNFRTKLTITRPPWKIIACCFQLHFLFSGPDYSMASFKFLACRSLLPRQRIFGTKLTTTRPSWKIIASCLHLHFPTPLYAAARLYSVAMGQTARSTERISSFFTTILVWRY